MPWRPAQPCVDCHARPRVNRRRCRRCSQAYERQRGTRQQRGLGADYERERRLVVAGATHCWRCKQPFTPQDPPTAGHVRPRAQGGGVAGNLAAEHRSCNYAAGAR